MMRKALALLGTAALLGSLHAGEPTAEGPDVAAIQLGKQLMGPPVSTESLTGKVVMIEFWGTH